jgi:hypothetical protein
VLRQRHGNDNWGLPGKISLRLQTSLLGHSQDLHCKAHDSKLSWLSLFTAIIPKRLISVSPDNHRTWRNVITMAVSLVLGVWTQKDVQSSLGPIYICERPRRLQLVHCIREHYPTPQPQHRRRAPIGKTAVSDGLTLCSRLMTGLSTVQSM